MFGWLRRRQADRNRQIFRFWDGSQWRQCDPIETLIKLQSHSQYDYRIHPQMVDDGDKEAIAITCDAVRQAFGVSAFDDGGLTIDETLALLAGFCVYLDVLKKSTELPVILPLPTEPISNEFASATTSDTSGYGLTGTEPN